MNTWDIKEVVFRKMDHHETIFDNFVVVPNSSNCPRFPYSSEEDSSYPSSKSLQDVAATNSELNLEKHSSEVRSSVSENEVYYQKLNARIVFPENYKCSIGEKSKTKAFKIGSFFGERIDKYSKFIEAIKNQRKCEYCTKKDDCYCQDESKVLLTALARNFFLTNGLEKSIEYPTLTGSRKVAKGYSEKYYRREQIEKHETVKNASGPEKTIHIQGEVANEPIRMKKLEKMKTKTIEKTYDEELVKEESMKSKNIPHRRSAPPEKSHDQEITDEKEEKVQHLKKDQPKRSKNQERPKQKVSEEKQSNSRNRNIKKFARNDDATNSTQSFSPETKKDATKALSPHKESVEKLGVSQNSVGALNKCKCFVDDSSSMPLITFQSCATGTKSITRTSLCSKTCSAIDRELFKKSQKYLMDEFSYPIGDSGILNTYRKEIVYILDKIIEEIQRLKLKKCQCNRKKVCFETNMNTKINQKVQLRKNESRYSSASIRGTNFKSCSFDDIFQGIDANDYIQMLLGSKIIQMDT